MKRRPSGPRLLCSENLGAWPGPQAGLRGGLLCGQLLGEYQGATQPRLRKQGLRSPFLPWLFEAPPFCLGLPPWDDLLGCRRRVQWFSLGYHNCHCPPSLAQGWQTFVLHMPLGLQDSLGSGESLGGPGWPGVWRWAHWNACPQRWFPGPPGGGWHELLPDSEGSRWSFWCPLPWGAVGSLSGSRLESFLIQWCRPDQSKPRVCCSC